MTTLPPWTKGESRELDQLILRERKRAADALNPRRANPSTRTVTPRPTVCDDCAVPLRPQGVSVEDAPGTRRHAGRGRCARCYGQARDKGQL